MALGVSVFSTLLLTLLFLAGSDRRQGVATAGIGPVGLALLVLITYSIDFIVLSLDQYPALRGRTYSFSDGEKALACLTFLLFALVFLAGFHYGSARNQLPQRDPVPRTGRQAASAIRLALAAAIAVAYLNVLSSGFDIDLSERGAEKARLASESPALAVLWWVIAVLATMELNLGGRSSRSTIVVAAVYAALLLPSGVRGQLVLVTLGVLYSPNVRIDLSRWKVLLMLPAAIVALTLYRFHFRAAQFYDGGFLEYLGESGGWLNVLFRTDELSFAEIFSLVLANPDLVPRTPGEGLLGAILYLVPRDIVGWLKPMPLNALFSLEVSPQVYLATRSELVVGGFAEAIFEWGAPLALLYVLIFAALLGRCGSALANRFHHHQASVMVILSMLVLFYIRVDTFTLGLILWAAVAAILAVTCMGLLLQLAAGALPRSQVR